MSSSEAASTGFCTACVESCERCIEECLSSDPSGKAACIRACRDCIDICLLVSQLTARNGPLVEAARRLCKEACVRCAEEREGGLHCVRGELRALWHGVLLRSRAWRERAPSNAAPTTTSSESSSRRAARSPA